MKPIFYSILAAAALSAALQPTARASIAYGSINNFDTVNDTGHDCHGFEIELEDCHSTDITYTYNYNHYGVPQITQDDSIAGHPRCLIRWASKKNADGSWAAYTAIPSGPIAPTNGHMFTNPSVNFGGEHFGVGYYMQPSAVKYRWLIDNGSGVLVNGGDVQVATPSFTYYPPAPGVPAQVQAAIQPPEPPEVHVKEFGEPVWVKEIRTTSHNNGKVELRDLVSDDPDDPDDKNWRNGEPDEVEVEWQLLQTEFNKADGGANGELQGAPEDLNDGDEVVTRRYEFFKYTGPIDDETGEAMCDNVGPDDIHGDGIKEVNGVEVDFSTIEVVGEYTGAQMAAVDVEAVVSLTEHLCEGRINTPYTARTVIVGGATPFTATLSGVLPAGLTLDLVTGILSGTPTESGEFSFKVTASDEVTPAKEKNYTLLIAAAGEEIAPHCLLDIAAEPVGAGSTTGSDSYPVDADAEVTATANEGYHFLHWENEGQVVSTNAVTTVAMKVNQSLVAKFAANVPQWFVTAAALPVTGGTVTGEGFYDDAAPVTMTAVPNAGYAFVNWTEGGVQVSASATFTFNIAADHDLVANFAAVPVYTIATSAAPVAGGTTTGGGSYAQGASVTVTATATPGYMFLNWKQGTTTVSTNPNYTFTVSADRTLVANFQVDAGTRTITTSSNPTAGGTTSGGGTYAVGGECILTATPNENYMFKRWQLSGNTVSSSATYTFTVSANAAYTARFARIYPVTSSSNPAAGGTTSIEGTFEDGDDVIVTATANPGYVFVNWTEGGAVVSEEAVYEFRANPARNLVANFSGNGPQTWTVNVSASPVTGGTVSGGGVIANGTSATVNAVPAPGYQFLRWVEGGVEVSNTSSFTFSVTENHTLSAVFVPLASGVKFDFDSSPLPAIPGVPLPLDQMSGGVTANFSTPDAGGFTVSTPATGFILSGFSGKYLVPGEATTVLEVSFDQMLTAASLRFAVMEALGLPQHSSVTITAYDTSLGVPVEGDSTTSAAAEIPGDTFATGMVTLNATAPFNGLRIEITGAAEAGARLLCDELSVTPDATGGGSLLLANPNWNITLTDFGYSDFLLDNTPGFEGREYLSGEWGAAVGYTRGNANKAPTWLEPNFLFPDWNTNSDFTVVMPITLIASNADGLPVAQSILSNGDLEVTIRYEMLDTVTGMPMGVSAASDGGAGDAVKSNRYVLNQAYTIRNISGQTVSNLQFFQLLHGFTSEHGVFDNRLYAGNLSGYRYDATLAGVDMGTIGADGSSASGLEDYISFSATQAPSAFEIGHYGIEGIDDHGAGKPSDGVHLSIEDNWSTAPYTSRNGLDYFAPNDRWIAGGQRFNLPVLADGQSATIDVMLSILTGTTVQVNGGGGGGTNPGSGSCNGGSSHVGGVDFEIEDVTEDGTFFGEDSESDELEIEDMIEDGLFSLPNFVQPGGLSQVWDLTYTGSYNGRIRLTFAYDPALIPAGFDLSRLTMYHYHSGAWEQMVGTVDPVRHTITVSTESLSPFMLGVTSANAIPELKSRQVNAATLELSWQGDTTGWILQENTSLDPNGWVNSTAPVTQNGPVFRTTQSSGPQRCFFRLVHP